MTVISNTIKLTFPIFGRCHGDFIKSWEEVPDTFGEIFLQTEFGLLKINFDWEKQSKNIEEKLSHNYYTLEDYFAGRVTEEELHQIKIEQEYLDIDCSIEVLINGKIKESNDSYEVEFKIINYHIENILYHIFLAMNLSTPGLFNCFSRELLAQTDLEVYELSASPLESAWIYSIKEGWPLISRIELVKVWAWIKSLNLESRQIAQNRTERALFSILQLCREDKVSPTQIMWVSLALEALYDTPKGQITKTLVERIFLFLGVPDINKNKFKKKINRFYELRSRFVHGELDITNPLSNNILDDNCFDYEAEISELTDFGLSLVIATLQKMIQNNWTTLIFEKITLVSRLKITGFF